MGTRFINTYSTSLCTISVYAEALTGMEKHYEIGMEHLITKS